MEYVKVKIEKIINHLEYEMKAALGEAVLITLPGVTIDRSLLFQEFVRAVGRKCHIWQKIPKKYIKID